MASTKTIPPTQEAKGSSIEYTIHKLKLQWIMALDETERRRISEEIRRQIGGVQSAKRP